MVQYMPGISGQKDSKWILVAKKYNILSELMNGKCLLSKPIILARIIYDTRGDPKLYNNFLKKKMN